MRKTAPWRHWIWVVVAALAAGAGCGARAAPPPQRGNLVLVTLDGREVSTASHRSLLDLLLSHSAFATRLLEEGARTGDHALVIMDGLAIQDGTLRLNTVPIHTVSSVNVLRGPQAVLRYGARAGKGAIEVQTRQGWLRVPDFISGHE